MKVRVCFEMTTTDEDGESAAFGVAVNLGETEKQLDYQELTQNINIGGVLKVTCLDGIVRPENVRVINSGRVRRKIRG